MKLEITNFLIGCVYSDIGIRFHKIMSIDLDAGGGGGQTHLAKHLNVMIQLGFLLLSDKEHKLEM
jgi:hypothetical protein